MIFWIFRQVSMMFLTAESLATGAATKMEAWPARIQNVWRKPWKEPTWTA